MIATTVASVLAALAASAAVAATLLVDLNRRRDERDKEVRQQLADDLKRRADRRVEIYTSAFANLTELEHLLRGAISRGSITPKTYPPIEMVHLKQVMTHAQVQLIGGDDVVEATKQLAMTLNTVTLSLRKIGGSLPATDDTTADEYLDRAEDAMRSIPDVRRECRRAMRLELAPLVELPAVN